MGRQHGGGGGDDKATNTRSGKATLPTAREGVSVYHVAKHVETNTTRQYTNSPALRFR